MVQCPTLETSSFNMAVVKTVATPDWIRTLPNRVIQPRIAEAAQVLITMPLYNFRVIMVFCSLGRAIDLLGLRELTFKAIKNDVDRDSISRTFMIQTLGVAR
jgi:hypothetical protein